MSHSLYALSQESNQTVYQLLEQKVGLTARSGIIASFVREARGSEPGGWHMKESDLLGRFGGDPNTRAIVVDLKPRSTEGIVNLFRMRGIVGYSYATWTPICFLLEELIDNVPAEDPTGFKREFPCPAMFQGKKAVSPVYLRAGTQKEGNVWFWGRGGVVNGPVLFPEAWSHFDHELRSSWFVEPRELRAD